MFARSAFRAAQPFRNNIRRYATDAPAAASRTFLYTGLAVAGAGGAFFLYNRGNAIGADASKTVKPAVPSTPAFTGGDQGFLPLKLDSVESINHNTKKFTFLLPEENNVSGLKIASALLTKYQVPGEEKPTVRPYTPTSDEDQRGFLELVVKKYEKGPMSTHLHEMKPGETLDFKGPIPKYPLDENKHEHIAVIAGGTGITPMWQLIRAIFKNPNDKTKVTLVFGNISEEDILLKKELAEIENTYPNRFSAVYVLDKPSKDWAGGKGFITKELLKQVLPEPKAGNIQIFVCGPPGLYKAISGTKKSPKDQGELTGLLKDLGYSQDQVFKF